MAEQPSEETKGLGSDVCLGTTVYKTANLCRKRRNNKRNRSDLHTSTMSLPYPLSRAREAQLFRWYYSARSKPYGVRRWRRSRVQATFARTRTQAPRYYEHFSGEADRLDSGCEAICAFELQIHHAGRVVERAKKVVNLERGMWKEARRGEGVVVDCEGT
jgi:hypothetical protein